MPSARGDLDALTERERQTLRLIVRGLDAKSTARHLGLSVHTVNERLREARRKLAVSSSREAARLLFQTETDAAAPDPQSLGDTPIGGEAPPVAVQAGTAPLPGAGPASRRPPLLVIGASLMTILLAMAALAGLPRLAVPAPAPQAAAEQADPAVVAAARDWLALVDAGRWADSYRATAAAFRRLNTEATWAAASTRVRVPLGAMTTRTFLSQQEVPAPPRGYTMVKFRTSFANRLDAEETVTLDREDGGWRVVGITVG